MSFLVQNHSCEDTDFQHYSLFGLDILVCKHLYRTLPHVHSNIIFHTSMQQLVNRKKLIWTGYTEDSGQQKWTKQYSIKTGTYTIWSKVSGHLLETVIQLSLWHTSQSWILIPGGPTLCLYDSLNSAGETFYQVSERLRRNGSPFFLQSCSQSSKWCGALGLEQSWHSNSSHRCSIGLRSGLWADQSISGTLLSINHSLTDLL
jgi:hypothetical protein